MMGPMDERPKVDRTWLCSVVFVDIVHYSVQSVELQMSWKERLNRYLGEAIQDVPEQDRVILDTGDGAALCFLGDPEAAMFCALRLLGSLVQEEPKQDSVMRARVGINLGPVKLVRDINGNLNAIGDGINVGERVMSFAKDNQILVSRSFYEVVSCLSESYSHLFKFEGVRRDKHVREHTVYELLLSGPARQQSGEVLGSSPAEPAASPLDPAVIDRIESCFAPILGPMAHLLVEKVSSRASTPLEVCRALMEYIPAKEDQEAFLESCGVEPSSSPPSEPAPAQEPDGPSTAWDPGVLERARRDLAAYMGPVARLIVDRASAKARTEDELYDLLAAEIASPGDREKFRQSAPSPTPPDR